MAGFPQGQNSGFPSEGMNQLHGDVNAGPGAGNQAATLQNTANVKAIIGADAAALTGIQYLETRGIDPTGTTAFDTIFNAALAALPTITIGGVAYPYGVIVFPAGQFKCNGGCNTMGPFVWIIGQGDGVTIIYNDAGTAATTFTWWEPAYAGSFPYENPVGETAGIASLTLDGTNAAAGSYGLQFGDFDHFRLFDIGVQHFNLAGSRGINILNRVDWTEKFMGLGVRVYDNTIHVAHDVADGSTQTGISLTSASGGVAVFSIASGAYPSDFTAGALLYGDGTNIVTPSSASVSTLKITSVSGTTLTCSYTGTAPTQPHSPTTGSLTQCSASNSHSYGCLQLEVAATVGYSTTGGTKNSGQVPLALLHGAVPTQTTYKLKGNLATSTLPFDTAVFTGGPSGILIGGAMLANHPTQGNAYFNSCDFQGGLEGDGGNTYIPTDIVATSGNGFAACSGNLFFLRLTAASLGSATFWFDGPIVGDATLVALNQAPKVNWNQGQIETQFLATPFLAETFDVGVSPTNATLLSDGVIYAMAIYLRAGTVVSTITWIASANVNATAVFGIYNAAGTLVASVASAVYTTSSQALQACSLSASWTVPTNGVYWVAVLQTAHTTALDIVRSNQGITNWNNLGASGTLNSFVGLRSLTYNTGLSALPNPLSASSATPAPANNLWFGLS